MLNRVQGVGIAPFKGSIGQKKVENNSTNVVQFKGADNKINYGADKLALAYRAYNKIDVAKSVPFTGHGLSACMSELEKSMVTCYDPDAGVKGEKVGSRIDINELTHKFLDDFTRKDDAVKTTILISEEKDKNGKVVNQTDGRTQVRKLDGKDYRYEMIVRPPKPAGADPFRTKYVQQILQIDLEPYHIVNEYGHRHAYGTKENVYLLNTKGKQMAVVEDGENVLLTATGTISKKPDAKKHSQGTLNINAQQFEFRTAGENGHLLSNAEMAEVTAKEMQGIHDDAKLGIKIKENKFREFDVPEVIPVSEKEGGSLGGGTDIVIGMEQGRFVPEIIDSIETFCAKVQSGEIVLEKFVPAKNADKTQIVMLAGGFGSRAEYTNAASDKIFHGNPKGADATKGCYRTATGLTPMETSFISLHKAGLLDCSKENLGIGKNIKFYINNSGENKGNGGFTQMLYKKMEREGREHLMILPNDSMSRMPNAIGEVQRMMTDNNAAMVMIAKEVDQETARGNLGIMKIGDDKSLQEFAEKPKDFAPGYVQGGKCFANTFQFAVSKEAFQALDVLEDYLPPVEWAGESRDWSKVLTPVIMAVTQNDDPYKMQQELKEKFSKVFDKKLKQFKANPKNAGKDPTVIPVEKLEEAKRILGNQKVYAVKTAEPWADCGTLNALYKTTMDIASGAFPLEDFERANVLKCVNTKTGLIASSPEQKKQIEEKYDIEGQVVVTNKAKKVEKEIVDKYDFATTYPSPKEAA